MKKWYPLLAVLGALSLGACGPTVEPEPASEDTLGSATAELNTCTNDCAGYGGSPVSCTGNTCSAASNYVVCDGQYTYCGQRTCTNDCVDYDGQPISCTGNSCSAADNYVVCDGVYTYCRTRITCTSPMVLCPDFTELRCEGYNTCTAGNPPCSVECDGRIYTCPNVQPGRHCLIGD